MHINKHNPYQNFKSMSGLPCMLSKSSIRHVINVLDILSHTDWFQVVCRPRESCQHQTRAGFHWGGDNGLLEGLGGLPRVRGGSQQSHIYLLSPLSTWILQCTSRPLCQAYLGESMLFVPYFYHGLRGDRSFKVWFGADSKNECESDQPMRAQLSSTPIAVRGRSSSFYPYLRTAWEGNMSAWLMRRGRLHNL